METYIGCLIALCIIFYLSGIESLEDRDITLITCVGWAIYLLFGNGGIKWHSSQ